MRISNNHCFAYLCSDSELPMRFDGNIVSNKDNSLNE